MGYFTNAGLFLLNVIFGLYIFAVLLRFLLQLVRADFRNAIGQFLVTISNPPLKPLRRLIPGRLGPHQGHVADPHEKGQHKKADARSFLVRWSAGQIVR